MIFILGAAMYRLQGSLSFATGVGKEPRRLAAARRPLPPVPLTPVSVSVDAPAERVRRRRRSGRSLMEQLARVSKKLSSVGQIELLQMQSYPKFHNEIGVPIVRVGCREFECIGAIPPQDHPHIYLNMGDASDIVCPYCSTLFRFDPSLGAHEADPADCAYGDID